MPRTAYLIAFAVTAISVLAQLVAITASWLGVHVRFGALSTLVQLFASPLPARLQIALPGAARLALIFLLAALVIRRLWSFARTRSLTPPASLSRWPRRLLLIAVASLLLMIGGLLLSIAIRAGSGVPAALLGLPAALLLTPVLFYVEVRSLPWFSSRDATNNSLPVAE
jgi:hypothetical protein